jgi:hypothetical protein
LLDLLADEYRLPPGRIRPEDRLLEDLGVDLATGPQFFWVLEERLRIRLPLDSLQDHQRAVGGLMRFGELVELVARARPEPSPADPTTSSAGR